MASDLNLAVSPFKVLGGLGPNACTVGLSVIASAHAAVQLPQPPGGVSNTPDSQPKQFEVVNTSATLTVSVAFGPTSASVSGGNAPTVPGDGTTGAYTIPPNKSRVLTVDGNVQFVAAIASGAGPTLVYVTPGNGT